ncbi:hypothetical protein FZEAL_200 [Fusarium zealandicum]|uniref:HIT-type domain-containing protein n=1 Tax=Fusarium zealandicum TaxID=1053134 RepID=A0A8H4XQ12_9HYPO|nr:hypothetical protein FZEAL_200 [Fusarium zealandicum]
MSEAPDEKAQSAQSENEGSGSIAEAQPPVDAVQGEDNATPAATPQLSLCGVCNVNPPKYKCPRCRLPYTCSRNSSQWLTFPSSCSVACNKIHRENHPPDPEPAPQPEQLQAPHPQNPQPVDPSNPFRALDSSDQLRLLFRKYPNLPAQLLQIHAATLPPQESKSAIPASLLKGLPPKKEAWNHDIGIQNGKEALRKARRALGEDGDAVREYSELILHLMNTSGAKVDIDSILRQQLTQEDNKLIESLMAQEKR